MSAPRKQETARAESGPATLQDALLRNLPPQNLDAEKAVLGGALVRGALLDKLAGELRDEDFYSPVHRAIWRAMVGLWRGAKPVDLVSVAAALTAVGELETVGGPVYLADLAGGAFLFDVHTLHHAGIVREMAKRRGWLDIGRRIIETAYDAALDPQMFVDYAARVVEGVLKDRVSTAGETPAEFLRDYFEYLEQLGKDGGFMVPTPYSGLNKLIKGFGQEELIVLAARPGEGKTALALNLVAHAARAGYPVGVFSLEMGKFSLTSRFFSTGAEVDAQSFRDGTFTESEMSRLYAMAQEFQNWPISFYDQPWCRPSDIWATCRRWKRERKIRLAVIDYLQLVTPEERMRSREQEVSGISRALKCLAKELQIPVVLLAQVNREVEKRTVKRITKADLRESGAIEQDADIILLIQPPESGAENAEVVRTWLTVDKSRSSRTGRLKVGFDKAFMKFEEE